jgi:hypothetical protein
MFAFPRGRGDNVTSPAIEGYIHSCGASAAYAFKRSVIRLLTGYEVLAMKDGHSSEMQANVTGCPLLTDKCYIHNHLEVDGADFSFIVTLGAIR